MAFTRKFLSALGIEADKVDEIINAHIEVVDGLKEERDSYKKSADKLADVESKLAKAEEKLAKNGEGETVLKEDYDRLKTEYDNYKAEISSKETLQAKCTAYRELAKALGLSEKGAEKAAKYANYDGVELDKDGKIKDAEKYAESIKTEWADFIETTTTKGASTATPPTNIGNGGKMTKEEIYKRDDYGRYVLTAAERQKALAENPELLN